MFEPYLFKIDFCHADWNMNTTPETGDDSSLSLKEEPFVGRGGLVYNVGLG